MVYFFKVCADTKRQVGLAEKLLCGLIVAIGAVPVLLMTTTTASYFQSHYDLGPSSISTILVETVVSFVYGTGCICITCISLTFIKVRY